MYKYNCVCICTARRQAKKKGKLMIVKCRDSMRKIRPFNFKLKITLQRKFFFHFLTAFLGKSLKELWSDKIVPLIELLRAIV
jgi:hypothetical protein